ncbi:MAG TPA: hypothetical protein VJ896_00340 [Bacteroidales bacterium]|nr:hypothetical protein [Bacteroidales bacterium]
MKTLDFNQMETLQGGDGTQDWCNAIDGLGGPAFINSLDSPIGGYVGMLYYEHCM